MKVKRILSAVISGMMLLSSSIPYIQTVSAEQAAEETTENYQVATETTNIQGQDPLSNMILSAVQNDTVADEEESDYENRISDVVIENGQAEVTYVTQTACDLVLAFYSDDGEKMYDSVTAHVTPLEVTDEQATSVSTPNQTYTFNVPENVPEYYLIKAYLVGKGLVPLSREFSTNYYTKGIAEVREASPSDFPEELVVELDDAAEESFFVLQEDTKVITYDGVHNLLDTSVEEVNVHKFTNADEQLTSLKPGDVFFYEYSDVVMLTVKVGSIDVDGTEVTITEAEIQMSDVFSVYKIQDKINGKVDLEEGTDLGNGLTYVGAKPPVDETEEMPVYQGSDNDDIAETAKNVAVYLKDIVNYTIASDETIDLHFPYSFKWKKESDNICQTESEKTYQEEKKNQWDLSKYGGVNNPKGDASYGKIYGSLNGSANCDIDLVTDLSITLFGNDNGQEYTSMGISSEADISGSFNINGKFQILLVGTSFTKKYVTALIGVGIEISGKLSLKFSGLKLSQNKVGRLIRNGVQPVGFMMNYNRSVTFDPEMKITTEFFIGLFAEAKATLLVLDKPLGIDLDGKAGLKVTATLLDWNFDDYLLDVTLDISTTDSPIYGSIVKDKDKSLGNSLHTCKDECIPISGYLTGDITVSAGLFEVFDNKFTFNLSAADMMGLEDYHLFDAYYSKAYNDAGFGTCPHQNYRIDAYVLNNGEPVENAEVTVKLENGEPVSYKTNEYGVMMIFCPDGNYTVSSDYKGEIIKKEIEHKGRRNVLEFKYKTVNGNVSIVDDSTAHPDEPEDDPLQYLEWEENSEGEIYITGYKGEPVNLAIPEEIDGKPVVKISDYAFKGCLSLESVTIPDSVTSIGYKAFRGCTGLTSITIPDSVTSIGYYAFESCTGLTSITIPDSVTSIGYEAFHGCKSLKSIKVDEENIWYCDIDGNLYTKDKEFLMKYAAGKHDESFVIPDSVHYIESAAFEGCTGLTSITIPDSVTSIGDYAFYDCTVLETVEIGNSVTSIGDYAFHGCKSLKSIKVDEENICYCDIDGNLYTKDKEFLMKYAGGKHDESFVIPDSVHYIERYAFEYCTGLTSITIPDSVTSIEYGAFEDCTGLTSITIPDSVTSIGGSAFRGCTGLTSITIPDSVTSIGDSAFESCYNLTSITIPDSVMSIGDGAFRYCGNNLVIYGYDGSTVQAYAEKLGIKFLSLDSTPAANSEVSSVSMANYARMIAADEPAENEIVFKKNVSKAGIYNLYVFADESADEPLDNGNLLYITQVEVKPDNLTVEIPYILEYEYAEKAEKLVGADGIVNTEEPVVTTTVTTPVSETTTTTVTTTVTTATSSQAESTTSVSATATAPVTTTTPTETTVSVVTVPGDANEDGKLNVRDAAHIAKMLAQGKASDLPENSDFNGDGKINVRDAAAIAKYLAEGKK